MTEKERVQRIYQELDISYPRRKPYLEYRNAFELVISVILSAQTTDALTRADIGKVEDIIRSTGYFRTKAKNIIGAATVITDDFGGEVPEYMEDLLKIPGVGRKSSNVVRGIWFGLPAIIVDTHFSRVTNRLGLTNYQDPVKIEAEITEQIDAEKQTRFSMIVNSHGRMCCSARKPECNGCPVKRYCPWLT